MKLSVEDFHKELVFILRKYLPSSDVEVVEMNMLRYKVRIHIAASFFIDVFYAFRTQKVSFAVVQKGDRIFGIDNLHGWHNHPFDKPEDHIQIAEPSIEAIVGECTKIIKDLLRKR